MQSTDQDSEFWINVCEGLDKSRFVHQTEFGSNGNCMSACFASLLKLPIEAVPNFFTIAGHDNEKWWAAIRQWLKKFGLGIMTLQINDERWLEQQDGIFIVSGQSTRGLFHATLWQNGKMIHDPHPSGTGIDRPETIDIIYPLDPAKFTYGMKLKVS